MKQKHHITIDATVAEMVSNLAFYEGRSFSNMIVRLLTEALDARQPSNPKAITIRPEADKIADEVAARAVRKGRIS